MFCKKDAATGSGMSGLSAGMLRTKYQVKPVYEVFDDMIISLY